MLAPATIRRLRAPDVEACAQLIAADPLWGRYGVGLPRARRLLRGALAAGHRGGRAAREAGEVAVAHGGGQVLGLIWFRIDGTFHHSGYVRLLGVAPHARRHGVGRRLMRHAERRILGAGPNVFLLVSDFNAGAQSFYRTMGYVEVGAIPDYVMRGVTERVYRKTLGPVAAGGGPNPRRRRRL